jgi:hypothetical protein
MQTQRHTHNRLNMIRFALCYQASGLMLFREACRRGRFSVKAAAGATAAWESWCDEVERAFTPSEWGQA